MNTAGNPLFRHTTLIACLCACMGVVPCLGASPNSIPWSDNFEGYTNNSPINYGGWYPGSTDMVIQTNVFWTNDLIVDPPTNAAYVPGTKTLTNQFATATRTNVWFDSYVRIDFLEEAPALDTGASAMFYFNSNGYAVVQDGPDTNWVVCTTTPGGPPAAVVGSGWTRVSVVHNYTNKTWGLLVDNVLVADAIGFIDTSLVGLNEFAVGGGSSYLDNVWVNLDMPDGATTNSGPTITKDNDADGMADAWEIHHFADTTTQPNTGDYDGDDRTNLEEYEDGTDPTDSASYKKVGGSVVWDLPYVEDFEGVSAGSVDGWHGLDANVPASFLAQNSVVYNGAQSLSVNTGDVSVSFTDTNWANTNVWSDMVIRVARPTAFSPTLPSTATAGFYLATNGHFVVYDGAAEAWITLSNTYGGAVTAAVSTVSSTEWVRVMVHHDYMTTNWDFWASEGELTRSADLTVELLATGLGFNNTNATNYAQVMITNTASGTDPLAAYVDDISITRVDPPNGVDTDGDGMPDYFELAHTNSATGLVANADMDGDGMANIHEFIADTDPTNAASRFYIATMELTNSSSTLFRMMVGTNRSVELYAADTAVATKSSVGRVSSTFYATNVILENTNAVNAASGGTRFYEAVVRLGDLAYTNQQEWAMYKQARNAGAWYMAGTPIDLESDNQHFLNNALGDQVARGLDTGGEAAADLIYTLDSSPTNGFTKHWISSSWQNSGGSATDAITHGEGYWVRMAASAVNTNTVYTGKIRTNGTYEVMIDNGWNLLAWPFKTARAEATGAGTVNEGWGFLNCGGQGSTDLTTSDEIIVFANNRWYKFFLLDGFSSAADGRWWDQGKAAYVDFSLQAGQGFYYYHRGGGFTWTNSYGP